MSSSTFPAPLPKPLAGSPKNEKKNRIDPWWGLVAVVVGLILILNFAQPDPYNRILVFLKDGVWVTVKITLVSFLLVMVLGLFVGLARLSKNTIVRGIATVYVEVIRGIPMMVQIIFWYFASPAIVQELGMAMHSESLMNFRPDGTTMAIFGLTFGYAAYMSEVYRAGIQSISRGQMEAARSLGMNYIQAMRYVILPQAIRVILPPVGNEFITLLKDTALVSAVAVPDLTRRGREFQASTFVIIETWVMVALVYLVMTLLATRLVSWVEKRSKFER
ncbi:amino acid ABC transporter permease [bacterium]|nr:MAG: amino acid ABC transporter permease [bacterium]